jgi:hypothetical protein
MFTSASCAKINSQKRWQKSVNALLGLGTVEEFSCVDTV